MEIALLPFIESAFSSDARSREGAVGLWQFMPGTARAYGLHQDWWYDGRRTPGPQLLQRWTTYNPSATSSIRIGLLR